MFQKKSQKLPNKLYRLIPARTKRQSKFFTFELLGDSQFPGVIIQVLNMKMDPGKNPEEMPSLNCKVEYRIKKVPKGKYQNLPQEMETLFKETIGKVVGDILSQDVQSQPVINKEPNNIIEKS